MTTVPVQNTKWKQQRQICPTDPQYRDIYWEVIKWHESWSFFTCWLQHIVFVYTHDLDDQITFYDHVIEEQKIIIVLHAFTWPVHILVYRITFNYFLKSV